MNYFLIILFVLIVVVIVIYNRIIVLINNRKQAFSDIDVQMKLRYDLIPNLVETVKGYATHEQETLLKVTEFRAKSMHAATPTGRLAADAALSGALGSLFAVAENYPDLKANQNFLSLQRELSDIENKIAAARRFFNNATKEYNSTIAAFPNNVLSRLFGFREEAFFDLGMEKDAASKPVDVNL